MKPLTTALSAILGPACLLLSPWGFAVDFPVADTGQRTCYGLNDAMACPKKGQAFYGQDAQFNRKTPKYKKLRKGVIADKVTRLMWQQSPDINSDGAINGSDELDFYSARSYCQNLVLGKYDDWRLPGIKELYSLIDFRGTDPSSLTGIDTSGLTPFINTDYFDFAYGDMTTDGRLIDVQYWADTEYVSTTMDGYPTVFGVNFADGRIKGYPRDQGPTGATAVHYVRCVRDNTAYGVNSFVDNGDGTISDQATGLTWDQNDSGEGMDWQAALAWAAQKNQENYLGHRDWRLPNAKELQSIVDYGRSPDTTGTPALDPLFNATAIVNEAGQNDYPFYWTGTTHAGESSNHAGSFAVYLAFGRAMGFWQNTWTDVHGAGAQRSDPKAGDPADFLTGHGPQGDAIRIYNFVRLVRG
ncbi:MAG: DUF1566 domain-containing protein [Methylococcus sp.]|nr:DUF1566 domain-containing protein [Methylococcus sp.]